MLTDFTFLKVFCIKLNPNGLAKYIAIHICKLLLKIISSSIKRISARRENIYYVKYKINIRLQNILNQNAFARTCSSIKCKSKRKFVYKIFRYVFVIN